MGFHVKCSAADLIRRLSRNPEEFLGEPYALYIVTLCTSIDDEAIDWLLRYEMALDSITGPYAALLLFYNDAYLKAEHWPDPSPAWAQGLTGTFEAIVSGRVLRGGSEAVDDVVRYMPEAVTAREVFVRSTTYQSDAAARELGIVDQLPCLLLLDNPGSDQFNLVSLRNPTDSLLTDLRELLSNFFSNPRYTSYFRALREWHGLKNEQQRIRHEARLLREEFKDSVDWPHSEKSRPGLKEARALLLDGRTKAFRATLNRIAGGRPVDWKEIRRSTNRIADAVRLARTLRAHPDILTRSSLDRDGRAASILSKSHEILYGSISPDPNAVPSQLADDLEAFVESEVSRVMADLSVAFGLTIIDSSHDTTAASQLRSLPWLPMEDAARQIGQVLNSDLLIIRDMPRPSLQPHVEALRRRKKRAFVIQTLRSSMVAAAEQGPSVVDAIAKGARIISG